MCLLNLYNDIGPKKYWIIIMELNVHSTLISSSVMIWNIFEHSSVTRNSRLVCYKTSRRECMTYLKIIFSIIETLFICSVFVYGLKITEKQVFSIRLWQTRMHQYDRDWGFSLHPFILSWFKQKTKSSHSPRLMIERSRLYASGIILKWNMGWSKTNISWSIKPYQLFLSSHSGDISNVNPKTCFVLFGAKLGWQLRRQINSFLARDLLHVNTLSSHIII